MTTPVPEALAKLALLYKQRNALYGDNYKNFGKLMVAFYPKGVQLLTEEDHSRFALFVHLATKMSRYAEMFAKEGHADSLDDITVYSQMLRELDAIIEDNKVPF